MGLPKVQMGQEKYLLGSSSYLQACSEQCQPQKLPRRNHARFSGFNLAILMMVALKMNGAHQLLRGPLQSPESSALESQSVVRSGKTFTFFRPDLLRGASAQQKIHRYLHKSSTNVQKAIKLCFVPTSTLLCSCFLVLKTELNMHTRAPNKLPPSKHTELDVYGSPKQTLLDRSQTLCILAPVLYRA
jgi:hypothetical protein